MWTSIFLGLSLLLITIAIHVVATQQLLSITRRFSVTGKKQHHLPRALILSTVIILLFFASILESTIWALSYIWVGAIAEFSDAFYFSIVTFTTLGYGDITLNDPWRHLGSFEAAIGIIIFGWTTAIVTTAVQKLYFGPNIKRHPDEK